MAIEGIQQCWSFTAAVDFTSLQFTFVKLTTSGSTVEITPTTATTDKPLGVIQDNPKAGETGRVCVFGITKLVTGSAASSGLAVGTDIGTDASGAGLAITPGTDTTKYLVGQVVEASAAAAEYCSVLLNCPSAGRAA